jgi:protein-S-isoprenylcysteine O-methyltransferase Ste14
MGPTAIKLTLVTGIIVTYLVRWRPGTASRTVKHKGLHLPIVTDVIMLTVVVSQLFGVTENSLGAPSSVRYVGIVIFGVGTLLGSAGRLALKTDYMPAFNTASSARITATGPYRIVRHPIYLGSLLMILGVELSLNSLLILLILIAVPVAINRVGVEESLLTKTNHEEWEGFVQRTPYKLLPFIY